MLQTLSRRAALAFILDAKLLSCYIKAVAFEHVLVTRRLVPTLQAEGPSVPLNVLSF